MSGYLFGRLLLALLSGLLCVALNAQNPDSIPVKPSAFPVNLKDVDEPLRFTYAASPEKSEAESDTLPDYLFRMYDPARKPDLDYGTLGNLGSSARPLWYEVRPRLGFDLGIRSFELYTLRPQDLKFYRNKRSFSDAFFSQGRNNLEAMVNARFARTFSGGTCFSLDYHSINNLGQFNYQRDRHNALSAGLWVPIGKRYDGFVIFTKNVMRQQENGGIVSDTVFTGAQFQGPLAADINLPDKKAYTRYDEQVFHLDQHFRFAGGNAGKRALRASHSLEWLNQSYKFSDGDTINGLRNDSTFFGNFLVDERGLRNYISLDRIDNNFTINTFKKKDQGTSGDLLALGLRHSLIVLYQEPVRKYITNLFFTGKLELNPSERFRFSGSAALGVLKNIGEYQIAARINVGLGKAGELRASLLSQRRPADQVQELLYVSKRQIWGFDHAKPVETSIYGAYALPLVGFEGGVRTTLVNNYVYYNESASPSQTNSPLQILQLMVKENVHWKWLHVDNTFGLQQANRSDVLHLPTWFSKNSLYLNGRVFKKRMLLSTGVDFRLNSDFQPDGYQPLTGQFYLQDTLSQQPYPWIDLFLAFKVQAFRFFFRYENCSRWWDQTQVYYQTARYPQSFGGIRFGLSWRFMDDNEKGPGNTDTNSQSGDPNASGFRGRTGN
ncbi:MAG: hypothetical protein H6576_08480 [Lewinellaceae bacterium]|nr:hypothetical protein [Lewinellaceae bacterium]